MIMYPRDGKVNPHNSLCGLTLVQEDAPDSAGNLLKINDKTFGNLIKCFYLYIMRKIDVINNDFFEGETIEKDCEVIMEIGNKRCVVRLSSDPSIRCYVKLINDRWEIISNELNDNN